MKEDPVVHEPGGQFACQCRSPLTRAVWTPSATGVRPGHGVILHPSTACRVHRPHPPTAYPSSPPSGRSARNAPHCGEGHVPRRIQASGVRVPGIDVAWQPLRSPRQRRTGLESIQGGAQDLRAFADTAFDLVHSNPASMDIPDLYAPHTAVRRVLRRAGRSPSRLRCRSVRLSAGLRLRRCIQSRSSNPTPRDPGLPTDLDATDRPVEGLAGGGVQVNDPTAKAGGLRLRDRDAIGRLTSARQSHV